jgi:hypothetical protein
MNAVDKQRYILSQGTDSKLIEAYLKIGNKELFKDESALKKLIDRLNAISRGHWVYYHTSFFERELKPLLKPYPPLERALHRQYLSSLSFLAPKYFDEWAHETPKVKANTSDIHSNPKFKKLA